MTVKTLGHTSCEDRRIISTHAKQKPAPTTVQEVSKNFQFTSGSVLKTRP